MDVPQRLRDGQPAYLTGRSSADDEQALLKRCMRRMGGMEVHRQPWRQVWAQVAEQTQPMRGRWLGADNQHNKVELNSKLLAGVGRRCSRVLQSGLAAGLASPSRPWLKLKTPDDDLNEKSSVKAYLKTAESRIYELLAKSNFYTASKSGFLELGLFGVEACFMTQHWKHGAVCHALTAGEYWIGIGEDLTPDSLYRHVPMTVAQMVQRFGDKVSMRVREAYDRADYDQVFAVHHAVEPNDERVMGMRDKRNMVYRSIYWEPGAQGEVSRGILAFEGFEQQPFWAARWDAIGSEPYGGSPGIDAFGDLRQLQLQHLRKAQAIDFMVRPPMRAPSGMESRHIANVPGGVTYSSAQDKDAWGPLYQIQPDINDLRTDIQATEQQVSDCFYEDLFKSLINAAEQRDITAQQANLMADEKWTMLGPVIENVLNEKLRVAVEIAYSIVSKAGLLGPAPPELQGQPLKIEFVSVLAQMQKATDLQSIERTVQFTAGLVAVDPQAMDNIDVDETVNTYADMIGMPPSLIRSKDALAAIRDGRQKQQAAQQAQTLAPAAKDGAQAAQVLANTKVGGGNSTMLDAIMGNAGGG